MQATTCGAIEKPFLAIGKEELANPLLIFYPETSLLVRDFRSEISNPKSEFIDPKFSEKSVASVLEKIARMEPLSGAEVQIVERVKREYKNAARAGNANDFVVRILGEPVRIWGSEITEAEAEVIVEQRIQALRELDEALGYNTRKTIDVRLEKLRKDLYSIVDVQFRIKKGNQS